MNFFLLNVLLAVAWAALNGQFSPEFLLSGFILGYAMLWISRRALGCGGYVTKVPRVIRFFAYFLWELFSANLRVAWEVITPRFHMRPAIVAIPLSLESDLEITLLAQLITLTPGTLSIDVSSDKRVLYVHSMYVNDIDAFRRSIKDGFERQIRELLE
ncbi:MAG: Na+/H+ antiporter subunit E [Anaerolineae bacterium]|nr:Na+/H+ antiporter subunit E [Anaerolineae bacterium]